MISLFSLFYKWGKWGTERLSNWPNITQLMRNRANLWTQRGWLQSQCTLPEEGHSAKQKPMPQRTGQKVGILWLCIDHFLPSHFFLQSIMDYIFLVELLEKGLYRSACIITFFFWTLEAEPRASTCLLGLSRMWSVAHSGTNVCSCSSRGQKGLLSDCPGCEIAGGVFSQLRRLNGIWAFLKHLPHSAGPYRADFVLCWLMNWFHFLKAQNLFFEMSS